MKTLYQSLFFKYGIWALFGILIFLFVKITPAIFANSWIFSAAFLYFLLFPGWLLARIFRIRTDDLIGRLLGFFVLGLGFYFILNLIAIFIGISLSTLSFILFLLLIVLLIVAVFLDLQRKEAAQEIAYGTWRQVLKLENIYFILPVAIGVFIVWLVALKGPGLDGDPYLHLSIIRKALDGSSLSSRALAFTQTQPINAAYVYPTWHIFLAFLSKSLSQSIFMSWNNILLVLTVISFLSWYFLSKVLFRKTAWTILALSLFMIFVFYGGPGYLFTRLGVPDTLAQLILLPLGLGFSLKYILDPSTELGASYKLLIINFLIALMLLIVHGPHYFYLLLSVIIFGLLYAVTHWKDHEYKATLLNILKVFLAEIAVLIIAGIAIELKSQTLSASISQFAKSATGGVNLVTSFSKFGIVYKYSLLFLPLVLFFFRSRRLLFIIATMLLVPLIYWTSLQSVMSKLLSGVFTDRLLANTSLYFYVFTLILGTILVVKDRFYAKFAKNIQYLFTGLAIALGIVLLILEEKTHWVSDFVYKILYAKPTNAWLNNHYWWFLGVVVVIAVIILIVLMAKKVKVDNYEYKNQLFAFILMVIFSYILISPSIVNTRYYLSQPPKLTGEAYFLYLVHNDQRALNFVQNNLPAKSVILASRDTSKGLSTLIDQYMTYNAGSAYEETFKWVFNSATADSGKAEIVIDPKWAIDYVYLANPASEAKHFHAHPEAYQKIYSDQKTEIYQLIK